MSIYRIAKLFEAKFVIASNTNLEQIKKIHQICQEFSRTKPLWMRSSNEENVYGGDTPEEIGQAVDNIVTLASRAYSQCLEQGMPASGQFGYAGFLTNLENAISTLDSMGPFSRLDPSASNKFDMVKQTVKSARDNFTPVGIPAQRSTIEVPETTRDYHCW